VIASWIEAYAIALTEELFLAEGIERHRVTRVVRGDGARHRGTGTGTVAHAISYGKYCLAKTANRGLNHYACERGVWAGRKEARGAEAIWMLVIHEFAHVLQVDRGERGYHSVHNQDFLDIEEELMALYPFEEYGPEAFGIGD